MFKKIANKEQINNQDKKQPQTISELIRRYDLKNKKIYNYLDYLVDELNKIKNAEVIQQNDEMTETNVYSADAINKILKEKMKLIFPVRFSIYNTSKY